MLMCRTAVAAAAVGAAQLRRVSPSERSVPSGLGSEHKRDDLWVTTHTLK